MKETKIVVKVMPTAADILGRTIIAGLCGFIGAKMYCDAQAFKAKKIKHRKAAEPSFDDEIDVTDLDDKIDEELEGAYNRGVDALNKYYEELKEANNG